ncbi:hypothetical protein SNE35_23770 [Paucibacter sp. R3-3]|uniref:Uncharacterized protein n=1 Tax=Roseateles agri TaxID=3098619 RepID=A0ABU5DMM1_9BURK|nr:hypothetical protein [Paucibacter sp. R3-3]MDY0747542.1 hypothetical protein [Paucibacter sp. R3-3]
MSAVSELFLLWREAENEFHWASADLYRVAMNTKDGPTDAQFDYTQHLGDIAKNRHSAYTAAIRSHGLRSEAQPR